MSEEEEKKATHFANIEDLISSCKNWIYEEDIDAFYRWFDFGAMEDLLNLIEKQNNRLEQLEKENKELKANQCDHNISNECLRKSVIRDKIKELEKNENCTYCNNTCNKYLACKCLKEILGE